MNARRTLRIGINLNGDTNAISQTLDGLTVTVTRNDFENVYRGLVIDPKGLRSCAFDGFEAPIRLANTSDIELFAAVVEEALTYAAEAFGHVDACDGCTSPVRSQFHRNARNAPAFIP